VHVPPTDLRTLRQDGIVVRFALLDSMAFVLAEIPASGSRGTGVEALCTKPHWAFVIDGDLTFESGAQRRVIQAGSAFHVPAGRPPHRFRTAGAARIAGFEPIATPVDTSTGALEARGFEILGADGVAEATVIPPVTESPPGPRGIRARAWAMSDLVLTQARFGPGSGYTSDWCDAPHWGLVTSGNFAIEYESDVELLSAGDVYHAPAGPPGHRIAAVDPASVIDFTPVAALRGERRISQWRRDADLERPAASEPIAVAGLG
jgi:quercetin dioxygenase-like cupin family protein